MKNKSSALFASAIITGLLAGSVAMADNAEQETQPGDKQEMSGTKNSCSGKTAGEKNSCAGKKDKKSKAKKDAKNSCGGKNGCGEKQEK